MNSFHKEISKEQLVVLFFLSLCESPNFLQFGSFF